MRKFLSIIVAAAGGLTLGAGGASAHPRLHWHCLTTPSGKTHLIAPGVTEHAPHEAFENFHFLVHREVFGITGPFDLEGKHPLGPVLLVFQPSCPQG